MRLKLWLRLIVQKLTSSQPEPIEQQKSPNDEREPATNQKYEYREVCRSIEKAVSTVTKAYDTGQKEQHSDNKKLLIVTIGAVAGAWIYAGIALFQWCEMRNSVEQQVIINRPVLLNDGMKALESKDGYPAKIQLTIFNFGKTVALNATPFGRLEIGNPDQPAPKDPDCDPHRIPPTNVFHSALAPYDSGGWLNYQWGLDTGVDLGLLSKNQHRVLYGVGCVYYQGLDLKRYHTDICVTLTPNWPFAICGDTDRNFVR
jgi:hypothetical protein